ncbi:carbohydrate ABC transporter permease [Microbacterium capsulatum]|uniref:Carbohydrate ABC transporter permease n=1 Tax=Microbacterium capsulatum TaxID=3041921 RepID=A0ABU0XJA0_9MICO|nr:carbohydrate ABC transporter permease [Microbacterium sp. ASV81]MDQ4215188.1 carbohydrate ABC transporter permease [Microbacterium sp. ASV81]
MTVETVETAVPTTESVVLPRGARSPRRPGRTPGARPRAMSRTAVNGALVLVACYTFFPFIWTVFAATKNSGAIQVGDVLSFKGFDLANNIHLLVSYHGGIYFRWFANSILYAGVGAAVGALICVAAGYAFDKYEFRGKEKLFLLVLVGVLVPSAATTLPLYLLASNVHLVNTYWGVLIPSLVNPFGVYLARIFSAGYVPGEVIEAGRIDGASEFALFRRLALPMIGPGYVTILLFQFSGIWNGFFLSLVMLTNMQLFPVSLGMYELNSSLASNGPELLPMVMLGSLLSIIPLIVIFISLQRYWKAGLTAGSVK